MTFTYGDLCSFKNEKEEYDAYSNITIDDVIVDEEDSICIDKGIITKKDDGFYVDHVFDGKVTTILVGEFELFEEMDACTSGEIDYEEVEVSCEMDKCTLYGYDAFEDYECEIEITRVELAKIISKWS